MATPSNKSVEMTSFLERLFNRSTCIKNNICTACGGSAHWFRDSLSEKEFTISGLCQPCQDSVFCVDEP